MRILITGGAGFIGSHLADAYFQAGHEVAVLDNLASGHLANLAAVKPLFFECDITDRTAVREAFLEFQPEVVSHHAAQLSVKASVDDVTYDAQVNVLGLVNVAEMAIATGCRKLIFASSGGTVYGDAARLPTPEEQPLLPVSPYGISKMAGEHYLRYFKQSHGLDYTIFRYGNVYGPRQDPHGEAGVVAIFARRMLAGKSPVIHGDGEQRRDYVYVADVAKANLLALHHGGGRTYNIGGGVATSVNALFAELERPLATGLAPIHGPKRGGEVIVSSLEITRAAVELGWTPQTGLNAGLHDTLAYFRSQAAASMRG